MSKSSDRSGQRNMKVACYINGMTNSRTLSVALDWLCPHGLIGAVCCNGKGLGLPSPGPVPVRASCAISVASNTRGTAPRATQRTEEGLGRRQGCWADCISFVLTPHVAGCRWVQVLRDDRFGVLAVTADYQIVQRSFDLCNKFSDMCFT